MQPGVTTYSEAKRKLGSPLSENHMPDGSLTAGWMYEDYQTIRNVYLQFDKDGRFVQVIRKSSSGD